MKTVKSNSTSKLSESKSLSGTNSRLLDCTDLKHSGNVYPISQIHLEKLLLFKRLLTNYKKHR
jgi:hypothetical protein